jgi:cell division protein DivIC
MGHSDCKVTMIHEPINLNAHKMKILQKIPPVLINKYLLTAIFFLVWMFFFNEKDLLTEFKRKSKLKELQKSEEHLSETIKETRLELSQLKSNARTIEKYAREKYLMKKDNEDLFIIAPKDANK